MVKEVIAHDNLSCLLRKCVISKCISFCCELEPGMIASYAGQYALTVQGLQPDHIVGLESYATLERTMILSVKVQQAPC